MTKVQKMKLQNNYMGLVTSIPQRRPQQPQKKVKPSSAGAGKDVLWPENDGKEIQEIWTGRNYSGPFAKYPNQRKKMDLKH